MPDERHMRHKRKKTNEHRHFLHDTSVRFVSGRCVSRCAKMLCCRTVESELTY
jgi:hypothetical protein